MIEYLGKPLALRCDNDPEYISQQLIDWANEKRITLLYIQPALDSSLYQAVFD